MLQPGIPSPEQKRPRSGRGAAAPRARAGVTRGRAGAREAGALGGRGASRGVAARAELRPAVPLQVSERHRVTLPARAGSSGEAMRAGGAASGTGPRARWRGAQPAAPPARAAPPPAAGPPCGGGGGCAPRSVLALRRDAALRARPGWDAWRRRGI